VPTPRPEPEDIDSGFEAEDDFSSASAPARRDEPAEEPPLARQALSWRGEPADETLEAKGPEEANIAAELHEAAGLKAEFHEIETPKSEDFNVATFGNETAAQETFEEKAFEDVTFEDENLEEGSFASGTLAAETFEAAPQQTESFRMQAFIAEPLEEEPIPEIVNPYRVEAETAEADTWNAEPLVTPLADPYLARDATPEATAESEALSIAAPAPAEPAGPSHPALELGIGSDTTLGDAAVPRISIHIYCELAETAAAAEGASRDRRMARASTEVLMGGLATAVEQYQNQPTPSLVIVECRDQGHTLLQLLDRLAEVCDPGTKVVVIGHHNDIALYRELMRRGVSEYLVPPIQTLQLIRAITTLYADPSAPFIGRQIAFCGARGGVGSSTIAHNLAYTLSERMLTNTVIVDFDLPFGTAGLDFNQDPLQGVVDALSQPDRLDPVLLDRMMARCTDRLSLFAAPATLDDDYEIASEAYEEVAGKIRTTAPYIVLDLPHLWSNWMRKVLLTADDVVITATPDLACLRNAKNIVDLMRQARANDAPPWLVLNQVGVPGRPEIPLKDFASALGLEPAMVMPFDPKLFGQAANNGQMIEELGDKTKAAVGLQQLAQILARREPPPAPKKSLLAGLLKRK
jgi:pilus assembly protein CpaE